jgi:hypothetical protein
LDISQSLLNREFGSDYQIILGYTQKSFWFKRQEYSILTFDGSNWKLTKWSYELNKKEKPKKPKSTSFDINNQHVLEFLNFINEKGFYTFNQDSLNWNKKDQGDGSMLVQSIMDGTTEEFEIISPSGHRISSAHEPEQRQNFVFNEQRKKFIDCRNKFLELVNEKSR